MIGRWSAYALVAGAYAMLVGFLVLIVVALTTAVADGWKQRAQAAAVADRAPQFSADGSLIAFLRTGDGPAQVWVMDETGENARPLVRATRFAWGPGHTLVFARGGRLFAIGADGGGARPTHGSLGPARTRSGARTVYVRDRHVYVRDRSGSAALT
jgi:Tol biopolymer transport system component